MPFYCAILSCKNNDSSIRKRALPIHDEMVYNIWIQRIGIPGLQDMDPQLAAKRYKVCDKHFSDFCRVPGSRLLKQGSLPTLHLPDFKEKSTVENSIFQYPTSHLPSFGVGELDGAQPSTSKQEFVGTATVEELSSTTDKTQHSISA